MILGKWPTWSTIFYVFIYISNSLHVSSTSRSSSGETNCVNTTSGSCHSVSVAVSCAGRKFTSDLHTTRPPTATRCCIDTICLSWWWARCARNMYRVKNKNKYIEKNRASRWSFTKNHFTMHGQQNIKFCIYSVIAWEACEISCTIFGAESVRFQLEITKWRSKNI